MSFDFGYLVSANPAAGYASQYNAFLLNQLQQKINKLEHEASLDDFERGYEALLEGDIKKAIRLWEKEAQSGVSEAHVALGDLYHHRLKNLQKAIFHYQKAYDAGETKAGALILATKLSLGNLNRADLESVAQDIKDEPWFKYIEASLALSESTYIDLLYSDENGEKSRRVTDDLMVAINGGVLPAGTFFSRLYAIYSCLSLYLRGEMGVSPQHNNYFLEVVQRCAENGDASAAEIYLLWLIFNGEYLEASKFIESFDSQFEWPIDRNYDTFGLCKGLLLLPTQEKSVTKKLFGATKNVSVAFGSSVFDSITSDWEKFESFKKQIELNETKSEDLVNFMAVVENFGVVEARRVLTLTFINRAFLADGESGVFGDDEDGVFLHLFFFLALSQLSIEGWQLAAEKKKADPEYVPFIPVLKDFISAFFSRSDDFERKWNSKSVTFSSANTEKFNANVLPLLSQRFESLKSARAQETKFH